MHNTDSSSSEIVTRKKCSSCGQEVGHTRSLEADTRTTLTRCRLVSEPFRVVACCLSLFLFRFCRSSRSSALALQRPSLLLCYCCPLSSLFFLFTLYYYYFARITTTTSDHCCWRRKRRSSVVRLSFSPTAATATATAARLLGPLLCFIIYLFIWFKIENARWGGNSGNRSRSNCWTSEWMNYCWCWLTDLIDC